jgi:cytochrome d ubiquinol oxidase subunit II
MGIDLPLLWVVIIGFALMMYVVMDGFDLGIGILLPFVERREDRDTMVNTVAPVWDGNETWLVLGGAGLFAAFPLAYAILLSNLYLPLILMLAGLILRGVAFEFRFKAIARDRPFWDRAFNLGSCMATFFQGAALGAFIDGFPGRTLQHLGGALDWLSAFSVFTGLGLFVAYALLGATWLVMKTEGALQARMRRLAQRAAIALLAVIGLVSLWTPLTHPLIAARWFTLPNLYFFSPVPFLVAASSAALIWSLARGREILPFVLALFVLFLGYSGLAISLWPNIVPPDIPFWRAAAPPQSLGFTLVGALLIIPVILGYTAWAYYVFRGKVTASSGYHDDH